MSTDLPTQPNETWNPALKPIETNYRGFLCRSRLEARWMLFFDELGFEFQYEPQGFVLPAGHHYLPDFWFPKVRYWGKVKPGELTGYEMEKSRQLALGSMRPLILLVGPPGFISYTVLAPQQLDQSTELLEESLSLDIHNYRKRYQEGGLWWCRQMEANEDLFTPQYRAAVYASRAARFDERSE